MDFGRGRGERADPLERRFIGKAIVLGVLVVVVVAFVFSAQRADPVHLPGVALDSPFLLDMERAAVVAALVVGAAVFLVRGWVGYFPSKLSTSGAEYPSLPGLDRALSGAEEIASEISVLRERQRGTAAETREAVEEQNRRIDALEAHVTRLEGAPDKDDRL
jgi:hypothetical protein